MVAIERQVTLPLISLCPPRTQLHADEEAGEGSVPKTSKINMRTYLDFDIIALTSTMHRLEVSA